MDPTFPNGALPLELASLTQLDCEKCQHLRAAVVEADDPGGETGQRILLRRHIEDAHIGGPGAAFTVGAKVKDWTTGREGEVVSVNRPAPILYGVDLPGKGVVYRYQKDLGK